MKKLMFATALVASAAAFADAPTAINATSFEGYQANAAIVGNGGGDTGESGANANYFYYAGDTDGSLVKAFGGENLTAPGTRTAFYAASNQANEKYLELSTEGGILWRSINQISGGNGVFDLGVATNVAAEGIYLDTLVQFTPTEDGGAPELTQDDKLAIWLNVDANGVTNLMVRAGYINDNGTATSVTASNFVLVTSSPVAAGTWYRLTVKTVADVTQCKTKNGEYNPNGITGFEIYLDGVQLAAAGSTIGDGYIDRATDASEYGWLNQTTDANFITYLQSGKVFPSLKGETSDDSIQGVGFKGSGALDDLVWTETDPFAGGAGGDYKVVIDNSDVIITPQTGDLEALQAAIVAGGGTLDVTDVAAVNAALAAPIPGTSPAIPSWQALFLGVAPTTNGLEQVAIESITITNGIVSVEMSDDLTLMTGRGVDIVLKVLGSDDLSTWDTTTPLATATNTLTIPAITPAANETKKFYKVVVEFAASSAPAANGNE